MAYEFRNLRRQKVRYDHANADNPLRTSLVLSGEKTAPSAATITIYAPGGTTALVSAAAMTVSGSLLTYSVDTTTEASWPISEGYRGELSVTISGVAYPHVLMFDVVRFLLRSSLTADQIIDRDADLKSAEWGGDEDLSGLIEASRDHMQMLVEMLRVGSQRVTEDMILDSRFDIIHREKALEMYWGSRNNAEKRDYFKGEFDALWRAFVSQVKADLGQGGTESQDLAERTELRLIR